jgi:DNA-directed RNA polymerase subunit L
LSSDIKEVIKRAAEKGVADREEKRQRLEKKLEKMMENSKKNKGV